MEHRSTVLFVLILLSLSSIVISGSDCTYTILVKTGTVPNAGTDAKISLMLFDSKGYYIDILNLETWGDMPPGHDYFENGNLDVFKKNHKCLPGPICMIQLISDNTGNKPGWFVDYVEVIATGPSSSGDEKFLLNRWLALDEEPHTLQALVDHCKRSGNDHILRHQVNTISPYEIGRLGSVA